MPQCRWSWRWPCLAPALILPALLVACASPPALAPAQPAVTPPGPPGFVLAVKRGLPLTVGVYGVVYEHAQEHASRDVHRAAGVPAGARAVLPAPPDPGERPGESTNIGAGFIFDADGTIATAAHVVADADRIVVKLSDSRVFEAELVGVDVDSDVALVRIPIRLPVAPAMGRAATLQSGDWVVAIGDPYGLNRSVAAGIVGGGARHFAEDSDALFIQSDLALNPGNSGGPLLDASGSIVGMNLRMMVGPFGTAGVSLSMPIELVMRIAEDIKAGTVGRRPRLGAKFEDVSPPSAIAAGRLLADGAAITDVAPGGVAERIGLQVDDIVVGFNGRPLADSADLAKSLLQWETLENTRIVVYREGDYHELTLD